MSGLISRVRAELRQRRHHRAFRIAPPETGFEQVLDEVTRLLITPPEAVEAPPVPDEGALAEAATNLWRARRKLAQDEGSSRYVRQTDRYLRLCQEALAEAALVVQDHDGDPYHPGRTLEVVLFEDDPAATTERVLRTVRPSVYFRDRHIQIGQVVVGCPPAGAAARPGTHREGDTHA